MYFSYLFKNKPQNSILKSLSIFLFALFLAGCASSDKKSATKEQNVSESETQPETLKAEEFTSEADTSGLINKTGKLSYTGNEPFAEPAIFVSGTEVYKLKADKAFLDVTFDSLNGKQVSLYGTINKTDMGSFLEIHYYELRN